MITSVAASARNLEESSERKPSCAFGRLVHRLATSLAYHHPAANRPRQGRGQRGDSDLPLESLRDARFILRHRTWNDGNSETSSVRQCQVCIYLR